MGAMAEIYPLQLLIASLAGLMNRRQAEVLDYLIEENRVLKERLKGRALRLNDEQRRRLAAKAKRIGRRLCRIEGALRNVGHRVAPTTIRKVLKEPGIKPAPDRPTSWRSFLRSHWDQIAGTDFFTTEVWTATGLKTYYVLFLIELDTRRVHLAGITRHPNDMWTGLAAERAARFLKGRRFIICDGDSKFRYRFKIVLEDAGIKLIKTPYQAPNANAHAERFVRSIKHECLDRMIVFGEAHLGRVVDEYLEHYNHERNHQGIGNELIEGEAAASAGDIKCRERLGGLLKYYRRAARVIRCAGHRSGGGGVSLTWPPSVLGREIAAMPVTSSWPGPG
jgi:transposase InsO family protein